MRSVVRAHPRAADVVAVHVVLRHQAAAAESGADHIGRIIGGGRGTDQRAGGKAGAKSVPAPTTGLSFARAGDRSNAKGNGDERGGKFALGEHDALLLQSVEALWRPRYRLVAARYATVQRGKSTCKNKAIYECAGSALPLSLEPARNTRETHKGNPWPRRTKLSSPAPSPVRFTRRRCRLIFRFPLRRSLTRPSARSRPALRSCTCMRAIPKMVVPTNRQRRLPRFSR